MKREVRSAIQQQFSKDAAKHIKVEDIKNPATRQGKSVDKKEEKKKKRTNLDPTNQE